MAYAAMRPPTAKQIDEACRLGRFVFIGNRQQISGASATRQIWRPTHQRNEVVPAAKDKVWVRLSRTREALEVDASSVIITSETFGRSSNDMKGKRGPKPKSLNRKQQKERDDKVASKKAARLLKASKTQEVTEERSGQKRFDNMPKQINAAIEKQSMVVYELQTERIAAQKAESAARKILTKMMVDGKIPSQDLEDDLIAELEYEPKAKVHKKKNSKAGKVTGEQGLDDAPDDDADADES